MDLGLCGTQKFDMLRMFPTHADKNIAGTVVLHSPCIVVIQLYLLIFHSLFDVCNQADVEITTKDDLHNHHKPDYAVTTIILSCRRRQSPY